MGASLSQIITSVFLSPLVILDSFTGRPLFPDLQCPIRLESLLLDISNYNAYPIYFMDQSVVSVAEGGDFLGPTEIEEFSRFTTGSPYFTRSTERVVSVDYRSFGFERAECGVLLTLESTHRLNPDTTGSDAEITLIRMFKVFFYYGERFIYRINVYYPTDTWRVLFQFLDSPQTRSHVCNVIRGPCGDIIAPTASSGSTGRCEGDLEQLPAVDDNSNEQRFEGRSQACRAVQAAYVGNDPLNQCSHLAFDATPDMNNRVKCQSSGRTEARDLFDDQDFEIYNRECEAIGIDPNRGHNYNG